MLLRLEWSPSRESGRVGAAMGQNGRKRPFEWLRLTQQEASVRHKETGVRVAPRDLLHPLPLNTPTELNYLPGHRIRLTLLDANHMPGAVMFLVEGQRGAVLHTGDCRAEKWWLESLIRNPVLQRYVSWEEAKAVASREEIDNDPLLRSQAEELELTQSMSQSQMQTQSTTSQRSALTMSPEGKNVHPTVNRDLRLRNIYVDDEAISNAEWPMAKKDGVLDLVGLMECYPADTHFFFDLWTWGYEEIYIAIGKSFQRKGRGHRVHVDKYKREMYAAANDAVSPFLTSKTLTRFHACDRKGACEFLSPEDRVAGEREAFESLSQQWDGPVVIPPSSGESLLASGAPGPLTVYVKPISASKRNWKDLSSRLRSEIDQAAEGRRSYPRWLACPIDRHSTLPELQRFVKAFRPATITPTTSNPDHYFLAAKYLGPALAPGGQARIDTEAQAAIGAKHWAKYDRALSGDGSTLHTDTVADELRRFREALRQTLDLSQSLGKANEEDGYDGDVSGVVGTAPQPATCPPSPILRPAERQQATVPSKTHSASLDARLTLSEPPQLPTPVLDPNSSFLASAPPEAAESTTILDDDLARRYFIVLRMYIQPGLRLKNLPGGTEGPKAWRAVRKLRPELARQTEETMMKEVGVVPPPWTLSAQSSAAPSPPAAGVPQIEGNTQVKSAQVLNLPPHEILKREIRKAVELELARRDHTDGPAMNVEGVSSGVGSSKELLISKQAQPVANEPHTALDQSPLTTQEPSRAAHHIEAPEVSKSPAMATSNEVPLSSIPGHTETDWLAPLLARIQFQGMDADTASGILQAVQNDTRIYQSILSASLHFQNSATLLSLQSSTLINFLRKGLGAWSITLQQCPRIHSFTLLDAIGNQCEQIIQLAALLLSRDARYVIDDRERASLSTVISSTHEMSLSVEQSANWSASSNVSSSSKRRRDQPVSAADKPLYGLRIDELQCVKHLVRRILGLLVFTIEESEATFLVGSPETISSPSGNSRRLPPKSPLGNRSTSGRQGVMKGAGLAIGSGDMPYRPPKSLKGIADPERRNIMF
ncbi:unnamed protein product [Sympodiomycopsis kandeliae]